MLIFTQIHKNFHYIFNVGELKSAAEKRRCTATGAEKKIEDANFKGKTINIDKLSVGANQFTNRDGERQKRRHFYPTFGFIGNDLGTFIRWKVRTCYAHMEESMSFWTKNAV